MKKSVALIAVLALVASAVFAQAAASGKTDNLLFSDNTVITAEKAGVATPQAKGKAPSGKDALIVKAGVNNGDIEYRFRVDFKQPVAIKASKKCVIVWEAIDKTLAKQKGANMNLSLFTLCKDDNKLLRADANWDATKRDPAADKKSILMKAGGFQGMNAVFSFSSDAQEWTDTTIMASTKQLTGVELYVFVAKGSSAPADSGIAITDVHFE